MKFWIGKFSASNKLSVIGTHRKVMKLHRIRTRNLTLPPATLHGCFRRTRKWVNQQNVADFTLMI